MRRAEGRVRAGGKRRREAAAEKLAWQLADRHPAQDTRDLVHLACCLRREPREVVTFDRGLAAAWEARG